MSALFEMVEVNSIEHQIISGLFLLLFTLLAEFALIVRLAKLLESLLLPLLNLFFQFWLFDQFTQF